MARTNRHPMDYHKSGGQPSIAQIDEQQAYISDAIARIKAEHQLDNPMYHRYLVLAQNMTWREAIAQTVQEFNHE